MSGGAPPDAAADGPPTPRPVTSSLALWAPALAISGAAAGRASRITLNTMSDRSTTHSPAATIQAVRSRAGSEAARPAPTCRPQRWQNRARGERSARHPAQVRGTRLAPQALQNLPEAGLPQAGQVVRAAVIGPEA